MPKKKPQPAPSAPAYPQRVADLASKIPASITLTAEERAFYASSIADPDALRAGAEVESAAVLDDVLRVCAAALPSILAQKLPGYGSLRARYLLTLSADLAAKVAHLDDSLVAAAGASAAKTTSLKGTRTLRR